jgi:DNA-binding GntR family transcriptional regulator
MTVVMTTTHRTDPASRMAHLDEDEVRELNAQAAILESLAVRQAPAYDAPRRARLRAANAALRAAHEPVAAAIADHEVHLRLVEASSDPALLAALRRVRAALRPLAPGGAAAHDVRRHADEHDAVIAALAAGDHARAAERLRRHVAGGLPELLAGVAGRTGGARSST